MIDCALWPLKMLIKVRSICLALGPFLPTERPSEPPSQSLVATMTEEEERCILCAWHAHTLSVVWPLRPQAADSVCDRAPPSKPTNVMPVCVSSNKCHRQGVVSECDAGHLTMSMPHHLRRVHLST